MEGFCSLKENRTFGKMRKDQFGRDSKGGKIAIQRDQGGGQRSDLVALVINNAVHLNNSWKLPKDLQKSEDNRSCSYICFFWLLQRDWGGWNGNSIRKDDGV